MHRGLQKIEATADSPFEKDLMNRNAPAYILRNIVDAFSDGCVVGLNGKWGTGKTTFLSMWEKYMENLEYPVIHFNVWESDYINDPLIGFIAEFKDFAKKNEGKVEEAKVVIEKLAKVTWATLPTIISLLTEHYLGINPQDILEKGKEAYNNLVNKEIERYIEQKETVKSFQSALSKFAETISKGKPLIFVVDELDRCNPSFAVATLERIKHIFAVPNIVFVLSIDEEQLCNSIKGYFGNDNFDAQDYLKRFIDIPYFLPVSNPDDIVSATIKRFEFSKLFKPQEVNAYLDTLQCFCKLLYVGRDLSIRQLEKWLLYTRLVLSNKKNYEFSVCTIAFVAFMKFFDSQCYYRFTKADISDQEFVNYIEEKFCDIFFDRGSFSSLNDFYPAIAELLLSRHQVEFREKKVVDSNGSLKFSVKKFDEEQLVRALQTAGRKHNLRIDYLVNQVELVGSIQAD